MNKIELKFNLEYLIDKYVTDQLKKNELLNLINEDLECVKYIIYSIDQIKTGEYAEEDKNLVRDIAYYFI